MSNPALLSPAQFEALAAYVEAAVELAVATSDHHRNENDWALSESVRFSDARAAAEKALVSPESGE